MPKRRQLRGFDLKQIEGVALGADGVTELCELLDPMVAVLRGRGGVPGTWPPPHLMRPDT